MASISPGALPNCLPGGVYLKRVGPGRAKKTLPFRLLFDQGIIVGANSDSPVYEMKPFAWHPFRCKRSLRISKVNPHGSH